MSLLDYPCRIEAVRIPNVRPNIHPFRGHGLQNMEWNRRVAIEKEMSRDPASFRFLRVAFDESGNFLVYPTPLGIRVYFTVPLP